MAPALLAGTLTSAGQRTLLPAGWSPLLHLPRAALPEAVGTLAHCPTRDLGLDDADFPQVLQMKTPKWCASRWELCIFLAIAMACGSRRGLVLIVGPAAPCGLPLHGPFLSHVPNLESVTASWHLLHAHCFPFLESLWVVLASSLILDLTHASLALLGALTLGPRVAHTARLIVTSRSWIWAVSSSSSLT